MGIPWKEANMVGGLMGEKIVLTELIAYGTLGDLINNNMISDRSAIIASYALCGFANFGSIGIQLGGIGAMAPQKKKYFITNCLKSNDWRSIGLLVNSYNCRNFNLNII